MIKFSIIIPTYNRADCILFTINSVLKQNYQNYEILVIDDGGSDNTEEVISSIKDKRIHYFRKENGERGAARNFGIKKSTGDYITFLDSDDIFYPNHLSEAVLFIEKTSADYFYQFYDIKDRAGNIETPANEVRINPFKELIFQGNFLSCIGIFIQRDLMKRNLFIEDRNLAGSEDHELWIRIALQKTLQVNPVITSALISHDERSVLNFNTKGLIARKMLMLKHVLNNPLWKEKYNRYNGVLKSRAFMYIALHIALSKKNWATAWSFFLKSIVVYPPIILKRSAWGAFKHLILFW